MVTPSEQCFVYFGMQNMNSTIQPTSTNDFSWKKIGTNSPNFDGKEFQIGRFL
jgi:hypothetical protein